MNDHLLPISWIRAVAGLALASLVGFGCGGKVVVDGGRGDGALPGEEDVCVLAVERLAECIPTPTGGGPIGECTGINLCASECIVDTSCEALLGTDLGAAQQFAACLFTCNDATE